MSISGVSPATANILSGLLNSNSSSSGSSSSSSSSSAPTSTTGTSNLSALAQFDLQQIQSSQNSLSAYTTFNSTLGSVQNALIGVLTAPFASALSGITSSNNGVAYISPSAATNLAVNVTQLAQQQVVETGLTTTDTTTTPGFSPTTTQVYQTGTLTIQTGNVSTANGGSFSSSGQAITVNVTDGSLQGIANAINSASSGVTAKVIQNTTGNQDYQLVLTGPDTGAANGFTITGANTGGSGSSLTSLNYGTTAATNSTNYAGSIKAAQDAQYTVNGSQFSSPTNQDVPVAAGVNINLLTTGSTVISQPQAPTSIVNAANNLVSTLNGVLSTLQQFTGANGPLANDPSTVQMFQNDVTLALNSTYGSGQTEILSQIGITQQPDGTYAVSANTLSAAYQTDSNGTTNLISAVAGALIQVVQNYSGQYGQVTQKITSLQSQISIFTGQFQVDQSTSQASNSQALAAVQAYNLLAGATGGSQSPFTSQVT